MEQQTTRNKRIQIANIVAFVAVFAINLLSNLLPLNGRNAGEISDALPSYFTPAGYTFSIWSIIYLGLLGFIIYQALPSQRQRPFLSQVGWLFVISSVLNASWLFAWHYGFYLLSVGIMLGLLVSLIAVYLRLHIGRVTPEITLADRLLVQAPFSLYLGWITVATIANIASVSAYLGFDGFGIAGPVWSAIMMSAAVVIAGILLFNRRNLAYAAVLIWALFGIRAAYPTTPIISTTAIVAAILILILALVGYVRSGRPRSNGRPAAQAA